jgi:hypothetical protein
MVSKAGRGLGVFVATVGVLLAASGCGGGYKTQTVTFTEKDTNNFGLAQHVGPPVVTLGAQGPEKLVTGDVLSFSNDLLDSSKKKVGAIDASCAITRGGAFDKASSDCTASMTLPGGTLALSLGGSPFSPGTHTGSIIGGSGSYTGAGGTFTIRQTSDQQPSVDTFHIRIPKK